MEDVLIVLTAIIVLEVIAVILIYNSFDRINFRIERTLLRSFDEMDEWVLLAAEAVPGIGSAYFAEKKPRRKMEELRRIITKIPEPTDEMFAKQEELVDLCSAYNILAERYDDRLDLPVIGQIGRNLLRLRPWGKLDFYPDVPNHKVPEEEQKEQ